MLLQRSMFSSVQSYMVFLSVPWGGESVFQGEVSAAGCVGPHNGFLILGLLPVVLVTGVGSVGNISIRWAQVPNVRQSGITTNWASSTIGHRLIRSSKRRNPSDSASSSLFRSIRRLRCGACPSSWPPLFEPRSLVGCKSVSGFRSCKRVPKQPFPKA